MFKHFRFFLIFVVLSLLIISSRQAFAQKGFYLQPFFMYQYTNLANYRDHYYSKFDFVSTYKPDYGLRAIYNFTNAVGFETGLKYSNQGQKYKGHIDTDGNTGDSVNQDWTSELKLNYIQIPLMISFNSILANFDEMQDPLYMSIAMGVQIDYLTNAIMIVNPGIDSFAIKYPNAQAQFKNFFNNFNLSFVGNVGLNLQLKHGWQINTTLYASKTLGDVENGDYKKKEYVFDKTQFPLEYQFPISVKKEALSTDPRYKTKNLVYGLMLGFSYSFNHK